MGIEIEIVRRRRYVVGPICLRDVRRMVTNERRNGYEIAIDLRDGADHVVCTGYYSNGIRAFLRDPRKGNPILTTADLDRLITKLGPRWPIERKENAMTQDASPHHAEGEAAEGTSSEAAPEQANGAEPKGPGSLPGVAGTPATADENGSSCHGERPEGSSDPKLPQTAQSPDTPSSSDGAPCDGSHAEDALSIGHTSTRGEGASPARQGPSAQLSESADSPSADPSPAGEGIRSPSSEVSAETSETGDGADGVPCGLETESQALELESASDSHDHDSCTDWSPGPDDDTAIHSPRGWGGVYARIGDLSVPYDRKVARRIAAALKRLVDREIGTHGVESHRISGRRLVAELTARRCSLSRARRREHEERTVLIAVDVSGSCSSFSPELLRASEIAADLDDRIVVLLHSNGVPESWYGTPAYGWPVENPEDAWRLALEHVALTVALGDGDAGDWYAAASSRGKLVWLDNYCSSHEVRPASQRCTSQTENWPARPWVHLQGVGDPASVLSALRICYQARRQ